MRVLVCIFICIFVFGFFLFLYLNGQIELTKLRLKIPTVSKDVKIIQEENIRLRYVIDQFESPENLLDLSRKPEFSHLKQPNQNEIIKITP
jgi:hypothetical protein